jgi:hypothetical protein
MSDLIDPSDPLASTGSLLENALEVLDQIRSGVSDAPDPEWFDASLEYVREVLEAVRDRLEPT